MLLLTLAHHPPSLLLRQSDMLNESAANLLNAIDYARVFIANSSQWAMDLGKPVLYVLVLSRFEDTALSPFCRSWELDDG